VLRTGTNKPNSAWGLLGDSALLFLELASPEILPQGRLDSTLSFWMSASASILEIELSVGFWGGTGVQVFL